MSLELGPFAALEGAQGVRGCLFPPSRVCGRGTHSLLTYVLLRRPKEKRWLPRDIRHVVFRGDHEQDRGPLIGPQLAMIRSCVRVKEVSRSHPPSQSVDGTRQHQAFFCTAVMVGGKSCAGRDVQEERGIPSLPIHGKNLHADAGNRMWNPLIGMSCQSKRESRRYGRLVAADVRHQPVADFRRWRLGSGCGRLGKGQLEVFEVDGHACSYRCTPTIKPWSSRLNVIIPVRSEE